MKDILDIIKLNKQERFIFERSFIVSNFFKNWQDNDWIKFADKIDNLLNNSLGMYEIKKLLSEKINLIEALILRSFIKNKEMKDIFRELSQDITEISNQINKNISLEQTLAIVQTLLEFNIGEDFQSNIMYRIRDSVGPSCNFSYSPQIYLDGKIGLHFKYKNKNAFFMSFDIENDNILIKNIQSEKKSGFHLKLGKEWRKELIYLFKSHLKGYNIYLIEGDSAVDLVKEGYGQDVNKLPLELQERIKLIYNSIIDHSFFKSFDKYQYRKVI